MRNLDTLLAAKFRFRELLTRSMRLVGQTSVAALLIGSSVWAQSDVTVNSPTTLTGDDSDWNVRVLTISSLPANNASLSLTSGSSDGALVNATGLIVGGLTGESGLLSITGGSDLFVNGDSSVTGTMHSPNVSIAGLNLRTGASLFGGEAGSSGTAIVSGTGSSFISQNRLYLGWNGSGNLTVTDGATVSNNVAAFLGYNVGGAGTASVTGAGSVWNTAQLQVGRSGNGQLGISNGGTVNSSVVFIGGAGGATFGSGSVDISGVGSRWNATSYIDIGVSGSGSLQITNGGVVTSSSGYLGDWGGSDGYLLVSGQGSRWDMANEFGVGYSSTGLAEILNSGRINSSFGYLGYQAGGRGTVRVSGSGSEWNNSGELWVGNLGQGTLSITNGGRVSVGSEFRLGFRSGSGSASIDGAGSILTVNNNALVVGYGYQGTAGTGQLTISGGGSATSNAGIIGLEQNASGLVEVIGTGAQWSNAALSVGKSGVGILDVSSGGQVNTQNGGYIGEVNSGIGSAVIDGVGSKWNLGQELVVGVAGDGFLAITNGGQVNSLVGYMGTQVGSSGETVVTGTGSTWNTGSNLFVGGNDLGRGGSGNLLVSNGGLVTGSQSLFNHGQVELGAGGVIDFNHVNNFGALVNNGTIDASLTLGNGGTLSGNGLITGPVSIDSGSVISPGNSVGLMTTGAVALNGGGAFELEFTDASGAMGTGWDGLNSTGMVTINSTSTNPFLISVSSLAGFTGFSETSNYSWTFINATGGISGFDPGKFAINASGFAGGAYGDRFWLGSSGNSLQLNFNAVPEPSTLLPIGMVAFGLFARNRRRAKAEV